MIRRVLVPLDGSARAETVLPHVAQVARTFGTRVDLLHVIPARGNPWDGAGGSDPLSSRLARADRGTYLEAKARELRRWGVEVRTRVEDGVPAEVVVGLLRSRGYDAVALATHGDRGDTYLRLGSTAACVVLNAPTSVLLVPLGRVAGTSDGAAPARYRQVIAPLDCSPRSDWSLGVASSIARGAGASLKLVHVLDCPPLVSRVPSSGSAGRLVRRLLDLNRTEADRYLQEAAWRLGSRGLEVEGVVLDSSRGPAAAVREMATDPERDLVVLSAHGRGAASDWPLGGTAAKVTLWAGVPVLLLQDLPGARLLAADEPARLERVPQLMRASRAEDKVAVQLQ